MARKRIIVNKYGINIDLLSKTRKNIYNIEPLANCNK